MTKEYGYLCTRRPADLGTIPSGAVRIERMDGNTIVHPDYRKFNYKPWDIVYYDHELSVMEIERYELTPKYDFTGGLLTEFFQIREEIKQGLLTVDFDDVIAYNDDDKQFANFSILLLNTIRYNTLDEMDWSALYVMLCCGGNNGNNE